MVYLALYFIFAASLTQRAVGSPLFSLFHPLHHGHQALPVVQHSGFLADTHEVAAARQAHLAAVAAHTHHEHPVHHQQYPVHYHEHEQSHIALPVHHEQQYVQKYHGPIAVPVVLHDGHLADTPEVALAKSHHLGAVAQAKADKYYSGHQEYGYGGSYGYSGSHHGYGIPVILPNGHIADTHEVAAAKSAHLLAVAKAKADKYYSGHGEGYGYGGGYGYSGSFHGYGIPVVLPNGHLADTHEVAAAKAAHLSAVAHAKAKQAHSHYHHTEFEHEIEHHEPLIYHVQQSGHVEHRNTHAQSHANVFLIE